MNTELAFLLSVVVVDTRGNVAAWSVVSSNQQRQHQPERIGFDFKTTFHKNPQLTTTYRQKAPIAQYVRRIDAQIAVHFCAICLIYIMPKALGDSLAVSILIGGCVFYSPSLPCVCRHFAILPRCNVGIYTRGKMAAHTSLANKKTHPPIKILTVKISPKALGMM